MSSYTQSSWTPAPTSLGRRTATALDKDVCVTCNKKLPQLDENLLKHSLRMKSEMAQSNTLQKSLTQMLARNDDFVYPIASRGGATTSHVQSATSKILNDDREHSKRNKYAEIMRNRGLHDCEKLHTNSRKHEYRKWDFSHKHLADYHLKPTTDQLAEWWSEEDEEVKQIEDVSEHEVKERSMVGVMFEDSRNTKAGGQSTRRELESRDAEEDIPEHQRVHMAIERIRNETADGVLSEIHQIKDRHRQLEALTMTKQRALADAAKPKRSKKKKENGPEKDALRRFLLANANMQKDLEFHSFKEKTTVKLNRNFKDTPAKAQDPGVVWKPKWNPIASHIPGKISKSTRPACDAKKKHPKPTFTPAKPGDLPPCVYLPKHIDAKTPMESAILLEKFMKQTCQT